MLLSRLVLGTAAAALLLATQASFAESFPMTGNLGIRPPPTAENRNENRPKPGATTLDTVNQTGVAPMSITMAPNVWQMSGSVVRLFPELPAVAQVTSQFLDTHATVTFSAGGGPGTIEWCPKITGCLTFTSGTIAPALIQITPGENQFGGTFRLARQTSGSFIRVPDPPPPPVSIALQAIQDPPFWAAGLPAFETMVIPPPVPKIYQSPSFGPSGSVITLGAFVSSGTPAPAAILTGFPMGTGRIFVIDATPPTAQGGPFSSSTSGTDQRSEFGNGNIILVGGSVAYGGSTGANFFRFNRLSMNLPEPTHALGLAAGVLALVSLWRARHSK